MDNTALLVTTLIGMVACYFVCGIPFGLVIAARDAGIDVRKVGSGNIGATNVARSAGKRAAALTLLLDTLKGTVCVLALRLVVAAIFFGGDFAMTRPQTPFGWSSSMFFLACVCGHVFSPYLHFHGGKGIGVGLGAGLGLCWYYALMMLAVFIVLVVPTRYVSLGSIAAALSATLWGVVLGWPLPSIAPLACVSAMVIWAHRVNLAKLLAGEESKFAFHKDGKE